jgi:tetratricopeptide (TPR) repeat protein
MLHQSWGEFDRAENCYQKAIAILDRLSSEHPAVEQYRYQLGYAHLAFSRMLYQAGRFQEAQPIVDRGIDVYENLSAETPESADYIAPLSDFYFDALRYRVHAGTRHGDDPFRSALELMKRAENLLDAPPPPGLVPGQVHSPWAFAHKYRLLAFALRDADQFDEAEQMLQKAIRLFEKLIEKEPEDAAYWHYLADTHREVGRVLLDRKKPEEAEQELRKAVEIHDQRVAKKIPGDYVNHLEWSLAYLDLAQLLIKTGRTQDAIPLVTRGVEVAPANDGQPVKLRAQVQLANLLREAGDFDQALATYSEVIAAQPTMADAWAGRGWVYDKRGEWDKSEPDFAKVIELEPKRSEGWSGRALSHFHRQQWDPAIADFSKAIELEPNIHMNWFHRGQVYINMAQWNKAVADFSKVVEQWPADSWGWYFRAQIYSQMHRPNEAIADLRQAIATGFKDANLLKTEGKFEPLRGNDQFKKLVAELEAKRN